MIPLWKQWEKQEEIMKIHYWNAYRVIDDTKEKTFLGKADSGGNKNKQLAIAKAYNKFHGKTIPVIGWHMEVEYVGETWLK
jgi:hypothetical protein